MLETPMMPRRILTIGRSFKLNPQRVQTNQIAILQFNRSTWPVAMLDKLAS